MSKFKIGLGGKQVEEVVERNPIEVATETVCLTDFLRNGEIVPAFSFATEGGRGTSPLVIPFDEYDEVVAVLQNALENGVPERVEDEDESVYIPTYEILEKELRKSNHIVDVKGADGKVVKDSQGNVERLDKGLRIKMRVSSGRGAKITKIRPEHFAEFVDFVTALADERDSMMAHWNKALPELLAKRAKAAAEAAKTPKPE